MRSAALAVLACLPLAARPHAGAPAQADPAEVHRVEKLADGVWVIYGRGGNVGLVAGANGAVLVDDQFDEIAPSLLRAVRSVTDRPLRWIVNTHYHRDHTGANAALAGQVQSIVAHHNVRVRLATKQAKAGARPAGLPDVVFGEPDPAARARLDLHLEGVAIRLVHYAAGHTDGDVVVDLPASRVVHLGDLFFNGLTPFIDLDAGGSLAGILANVEQLLEWIPQEARLVPGHGPVGDRKDLVRYRDFLRAAERHVAANPGKSGAALAASFDRTPFPGFQDLPPFVSWASFFDLAAGRQPPRP